MLVGFGSDQVSASARSICANWHSGTPSTTAGLSDGHGYGVAAAVVVVTARLAAVDRVVAASVCALVLVLGGSEVGDPVVVGMAVATVVAGSAVVEVVASS